MCSEFLFAYYTQTNLTILKYQTLICQFSNLQKGKDSEGLREI